MIVFWILKKFIGFIGYIILFLYVSMFKMFDEKLFMLRVIVEILINIVYYRDIFIFYRI